MSTINFHMRKRLQSFAGASRESGTWITKYLGRKQRMWSCKPLLKTPWRFPVTKMVMNFLLRHFRHWKSGSKLNSSLIYECYPLSVTPGHFHFPDITCICKAPCQLWCCSCCLFLPCRLHEIRHTLQDGAQMPANVGTSSQLLVSEGSVPGPCSALSLSCDCRSYMVSNGRNQNNTWSINIYWVLSVCSAPDNEPYSEESEFSQASLIFSRSGEYPEKETANR